MAGVLNNCARPITLNVRVSKTGSLIKHRLNPLDFKTIPDGEWNLIKKSKVVKAYLDKGDLVVGKKKIQVPDDFEPELSEEELAQKRQDEIDEAAELEEDED